MQPQLFWGCKFSIDKAYGFKIFYENLANPCVNSPINILSEYQIFSRNFRNPANGTTKFFGICPTSNNRFKLVLEKIKFLEFFLYVFLPAF